VICYTVKYAVIAGIALEGSLCGAFFGVGSQGAEGRSWCAFRLDDRAPTPAPLTPCRAHTVGEGGAALPVDDEVMALGRGGAGRVDGVVNGGVQRDCDGSATMRPPFLKFPPLLIPQPPRPPPPAPAPHPRAPRTPRPCRVPGRQIFLAYLVRLW